MIFSGDCIRIAVTDSSQVGEARRCVTRLAGDSGFDAHVAGRAALIATELATNLVKYGKETGELLLQRLSHDAGSMGLEIIAIDKGPGLRDVAHAMADGVSTSGTPGTGLGAVRRISNSFHFHTAPGEGSVFASRVWNGSAPVYDGWGAVCVPVKGEEQCGDHWMVVQDHSRKVVMIADGLGHGPLAAEAAQMATDVLREHSMRRPAEILGFMHRGMRATRGAAVAIAVIDEARGLLDYAGVGNIAASIVKGASSRSMISHNGIVGHEARKIQEFSYPWDSDSTLVMYSDGISTRVLHGYPALAHNTPSVIAATLYRDFARTRDDATVMVVRESVRAHGG